MGTRAPMVVASVLQADFSALGDEVKQFVFCAGSSSFTGNGTMADRTTALRAAATAGTRR
jgi:hypothetical protein